MFALNVHVAVTHECTNWSWIRNIVLCVLYLRLVPALVSTAALHTGGDAPLTRQVLQLPSRRIAAVADSASPALSKLASLTTSGAGLVGGGVLPSLGQADHVPSTARKKRTQGAHLDSSVAPCCFASWCVRAFICLWLAQFVLLHSYVVLKKRKKSLFIS